MPTIDTTFAGAFRDGYTSKRASEVLGALSAATGEQFAIVWPEVDDFGTAGDSELFMAVDGGSRLQPVAPGVLGYLIDGGDAPLTVESLADRNAALVPTAELVAIDAYNFARNDCR